MVLVLGIVKASLEILGIGIGVKKVVLLKSAVMLIHFAFTFSGISFCFEFAMKSM